MLDTKKLHVKVTFEEDVLGMTPANEEIYTTYIASKSPDASTIAEEVERLGVDGVARQGMTVFPRTARNEPFIYDYQLKGFFKDTCGGLRRTPGSLSSKIKAYKKEIDKLIFVQPREITVDLCGMQMGVCERPLRASTPQGERISLACSESIPAGATMEFDVLLLQPEHEALVREWLDYGELGGFGQWRNSGKGRFTYEIKD